MVDLSLDQIRELNELFGSMHGAAIAALETGLYASDFQATGARLIRRRDAPADATGADAFHVMYPKGDRETLFWKLVWLTHARSKPVAREKPGPKDLGIPLKETFWIIERRLENGTTHSRKWLADETKRREELEYVPRTRLTPLVDWVDLHPEAAREAARLRELPPVFRAGKLGPAPPSG